jgi:hypothetical protein
LRARSRAIVYTLPNASRQMLISLLAGGGVAKLRASAPDRQNA